MRIILWDRNEIIYKSYVDWNLACGDALFICSFVQRGKCLLQILGYWGRWFCCLYMKMQLPKICHIRLPEYYCISWYITGKEAVRLTGLICTYCLDGCRETWKHSVCASLGPCFVSLLLLLLFFLYGAGVHLKTVSSLGGFYHSKWVSSNIICIYFPSRELFPSREFVSLNKISFHFFSGALLRSLGYPQLIFHCLFTTFFVSPFSLSHFFFLFPAKWFSKVFLQ